MFPVVQRRAILPGHYQDDPKRAASTRLVWLCVFAATSECIMSCFVPIWTWKLSPVSKGGGKGWELNVSATLLNLLGGFMEGSLASLEERTNSEGMAALSRLFRESFLGVMTSYSFVVEHAGHLGSVSILLPPVYIIGSLAGSCFTYELGRKTMIAFGRSIPRETTVERSFSNVLMSLCIFCILVLLAVSFGPKGLVRDPNDPQFIGTLHVDDGLELMLGIVMSCMAILLSSTLSAGKFRNQVQWGTWRCNIVSCLLITVAYSAVHLAPSRFGNSIVVSKFVSSFCGSLSSFSTTIGDTMGYYHRKQPDLAFFNINLNLITGLLLLPLFYLYTLLPS